MAINDILEKIEKESAEKISKLKEEFEAKKEALREEYAHKQKALDKDLHERIEEKSAKLLEKAASLAERESKNQMLEAKRTVIEDALSKAVDALAKSGNYEAILTEILNKIDLKGENIVVIPAKGKESQTATAIKASGKSYMLSETAADIKGGVIIKTSRVEIDNSFETIIYSFLRDELEIKINKLLF
ncbi:hypothetical protein GF354_00280 [Candidatus Peregrinibacteria bacterium]|nr:hypothetical protein [Candidatus Peregrinibacteria bacterium]